jgi:hypothetical protein
VISNGRLSHRLADLERLWPTEAPAWSEAPAWCACPFSHEAAVAELVAGGSQPCPRCGRWPEIPLAFDADQQDEEGDR